MIKEAILEAIEELREDFPSVQVEETGDGGAFVTIPNFDYGKGWEPRIGWLGTTVQYTYPTSEIYPFFGPLGLSRVEPPASVEGVTPGHTWNGKGAVQLSIRQKGWNPAQHTLFVAVTGVKRYLARCTS